MLLWSLLCDVSLAVQIKELLTYFTYLLSRSSENNCSNSAGPNSTANLEYVLQLVLNLLIWYDAPRTVKMENIS